MINKKIVDKIRKSFLNDFNSCRIVSKNDDTDYYVYSEQHVRDKKLSRILNIRLEKIHYSDDKIFFIHYKEHSNQIICDSKIWSEYKKYASDFDLEYIILEFFIELNINTNTKHINHRDLEQLRLTKLAS